MLIFDDSLGTQFYPLTLTRSTGDLRCGILKLRQRLQQLLDPEEADYWIAPELVALYHERHPDWKLNTEIASGTLAVNSRVMVDPESLARIESLQPGEFLADGTTLAAFRASENLTSLPDLVSLIQSGYRRLEPGLRIYAHLPALIHDNERLLRFDFEHFFYDQDNYFETEPGVTALDPYSIWIAEGVDLKPGVVLDASTGPIVLDEGVRVLPNAVICGPAYIGKNSVVKAGAKIYGPTSIGPVCKVGGEIEGTIIQAYSNKQHDGFLGHSYVGEWVNLGADTNNSDLKNTYKNVSFYHYPQRRKIDSGSMFLGALIGDHAKLGINTSLNTGIVIGLGGNLWGADLFMDFIPNFSWGSASRLERYRWEEFCATAETVKQRRALNLSPIEQQLLHHIYQTTEVSPE